MSGFFKNLFARANEAIAPKPVAAPVAAPAAPAVSPQPAAPVAAVAAPVVAPAVLVPSAPLGPIGLPRPGNIPPAPWPIDVKQLTGLQVEALTKEQETRANNWSGAKMMASMMSSGHADLDRLAWFNNYRGPLVPFEELNKPITGVWADIWAWAFPGVPLPVPATVDVRWQEQDDAARARAAGQPAPETKKEPAPPVGDTGSEDVPIGS